MTRRVLAAALAAASLASCAAPVADDVGQAVSVYRAPSGPAATTYGVSCDLRPLVLDPLWSEAERSDLRRAAAAWETAVGADLGPLPVASEPCSADGVLVVADCVAVSGVTHDGRTESYVKGIVFWGPMVEGHDLVRVAAHEIGHWIGIADHSDSTGSIMRASGDLPSAIAAVDIAAYREACEP